MSNTLPQSSTLTPTVAREVRKIDTLPFDELPPVLFREEVKFLFDERATLRARLEAFDLRHKKEKREIKMMLAQLRNEIMKQRTLVIVTKQRGTTGYDALANKLNGIMRSI